MSSREISNLTEKTVGNIHADIWSMLNQLYGILKDDWVFNHYKNQNVNIINGIVVVIDTRGYVSEFLLDRRHTEILITGYDVKRRAAVIDRWFDLESQAKAEAPAIPQTFAEALRLAADTVEENQQLKTHVNLLENLSHEQQEEIDNLKNLFKKGMTTVQFCKMLNGVNMMQVNRYLEGRKWLYNESDTGTRWRVGSYARDRYMTEHQRKITDHSGDEFIKYEPVLLRKGAQRIYELYLKGELPMKQTWDGLFTHDKDVRVSKSPPMKKGGLT
uniref:Antirepressor protein C-terminal domain-containing protein n=1 Tax=Bracon brevicornis TaxID=1563983 RepID=A0A6V7KHG1_9HYME